jgi:hypothetical protein
MPAKDRFRGDDRGNRLNHLPAKDLAFDGQQAPLFVAKQDSFPPNLLAKYPIFSQKVFDHILLLTIYPAGENQE